MSATSSALNTKSLTRITVTGSIPGPLEEGCEYVLLEAVGCLLELVDRVDALEDCLSVYLEGLDEVLQRHHGQVEVLEKTPHVLRAEYLPGLRVRHLCQVVRRAGVLRLVGDLPYLVEEADYVLPDAAEEGALRNLSAQVALCVCSLRLELEDPVPPAAAGDGLALRHGGDEGWKLLLCLPHYAQAILQSVDYRALLPAESHPGEANQSVLLGPGAILKLGRAAKMGD